MDLVTRARAELFRSGYRRTERLGVGFSGGVDSTALLLICARALGPRSVVALHVDHGIRPRSRQDAEHCRNVASQLGLAFVMKRIEPGTLDRLVSTHGLEGALRQLRYQLLQEACEEQGLHFLAIGHQADDAVETHFMALARGSGLTGLAGPRPVRDLAPGIKLLRPLLTVSRSQLLQFLDTCHPPVETLEDETNADDSFARNRIRHRMVPMLVELAGEARPVYRSLAQLRDDREAFEWLIERRQRELGIDPEAERLDLRGAHDMTDPAVIAAIRSFLARHGGGFLPPQKAVLRLSRALTEPGRTRWMDVAGARLSISGFVVSVQKEPSPAGWPRPLSIGAPLLARDLGLTLVAEIRRVEAGAPISHSRLQVEFDAEGLGPDGLDSLTLRGARPGDRFHPFGLDCSVRLYRWLAGQGIPRQERPVVPVVTSGSQIIWVVSRRRGSQSPVTGETRQRLCLTAMLNQPDWPGMPDARTAL